jgi:hypothetical protein
MKAMLRSIRLTWVIVAKDLRRLRWVLVLLGVVVVGQYIAWGWVRAEGSASEVQRGAVLALWGMQLLMVWLLVPQFVQVDPLIGTAEWRVRPISGARLLGAKVLGIFLALCVWPSVLTSPWWLEMGFGAGEIARVLAVNALGMVALTGVAMTVAVLTESFAKFIAGSLVLGVAGALVALTMAAGMPAAGEGPVNAALLMTRAKIAWAIVLGATAVVVLVQYLGRRPGLARGLAAGAAGLVGLVVQFWPWTEAQMLARTGLARYALPTVSARLGPTVVVMRGETGRPEVTAQVTTEFVTRGLAAGDQVAWNGAELGWTLGDYRGPMLPVATWALGGNGMGRSLWWEAPLARWAKGGEERREDVGSLTWTRTFPGKVAPQVRNGEALVRSRNFGTLWRGERGPVVAVRAGASAARGLQLLHVRDVDHGGDEGELRLRWWEVEPLYGSVMMLELLNPDGVGRHRWRTAVLANGTKEFADFGAGVNRPRGLGLKGRDRMPVGVMGVSALESGFVWGWSGRNQGERDVPFEGATLASVAVTAAAPLRVELAEAQVLPELIVEGSMAAARARAQAEGRMALVLVGGGANVEGGDVGPITWWWNLGAQNPVAKRFVCGLATGVEARQLRKATDDEGAPTLVVFNTQGEEVDRLRFLMWTDLTAALNANLAGKTYAAVLMEALAAQGGNERMLRFQLHEALRARGELTGAFNAILALIENLRSESEFGVRDVDAVGNRLERLAAVDGAVKTVLKERREAAAEALRRDAGDLGAARLLMVTTLALRHDDAVWGELPRLLPRANPLRWEFTGMWLARMVNQRRYREAVETVDVEAFFEGAPEWVRAQLARRAMTVAGEPGGVSDWKRRLGWMGKNAVEALAGAGQGEAALRVAHAVRRIDRTEGMREEIRVALGRSGGEIWSARWYKETQNGR